MGHQKDGWRCGYYALWYLQEALKNGENVDPQQMADEFTARVQQTVRDNYKQAIRVGGKVDVWLSAGCPSIGAAPKSVQCGAPVWVARWFLDAADKDQFNWDSAVVQGGSRLETVAVKFKTDNRTTHEVPLRHVRTFAHPPDSPSDEECV